MARKFEVVWANGAEEDLFCTISFIADDSVVNAERIFKKIHVAATTLISTPPRGRVVPELSGQGILQYRELIVPPWRIVYRIAEKTVYVVAVLDSRRDITDLLFRRLTR